MELIYKKIASVQIWLDYFLPEGVIRQSQIPENYAIENYLNCFPSNQTVKKLQTAKFKIQHLNHGFEIWCEAKKDGNTFVSAQKLEQNTKFSFGIGVLNSSFFLNTLQPQSNHLIAYFSNTSTHTLTVDDGNGGNTKTQYLFKSAQAYNGGSTYKIDEIVKNGTSSYLSLKAENNDALNNTSAWRKIADASFSNALNCFKKVGNFYSTTVDVKNKTIKILDVLKQTVYAKMDVDVSSKNINISNLDSGYYSFWVDDVLTDEFVKADFKNTTAAVIELVHQGNPDELNNLDWIKKDEMLLGNGKNSSTPREIIENNWIVRFLNRATYWKYIFNKNQIIDNTELAAAGFIKISDQEIESKNAKPLQNNPQIIDPGVGYILPNPNPDSIKILVDSNKNIEKYISELYINN